MDTKYTNRKSKRMFVNMLSIFVILVIVFPAAGGVSAQEPSPGLRAFPDQDRADGMFWPVGQLVYLTINGNPFEPQTADDTGYVEFLLGEYDLKRGDTLTLSSGDISVTHIARQLFVDNIDLDAQTVFGTVDGQQTVHVWTGESQLYVEADESGNWYADFSSFGGVLSPGVCGNAEAWEGPGSTIIDWCLPLPPPNPHFTVFPEWEWFDGWEWPDGATVEITVDGKKECTTSRQSSGNFFNGNFGEGCDIAVGDIVTFTDGTTMRTHTVRNLAITDVDKVANTIEGKADDRATVHAWVHEYGYEMELQVANGTWLADFGSAGLDLVENMGGRAEIRDEFGNGTAVDWWIPNPIIIAHPDQEWVEGWSFQNGSEVELTVYDGEGTLLYQDTSVAAPPDWDPGNPNAFVRFNVGYDLKAGDHLWMTDGASTKDLIVTALMPTGIDPGGQVVYGVADPDSEVTLEHQGEMWVVTADSEGNWSATVPVLAGGSDVLASQWDDDGDMTRIAFHIPNPRFVVFPEWEWFDGNDWPDGATVNITVEGKPECATSRMSQGYFFNGPFGEGCDLMIGDIVTFTDGTTARTHTVQNLAVIDVDIVTNIVGGKADAGAVIQVWPHETGEQLQATANAPGNWQVDFTGLFDLVEGTCGRSQILVGDNATAVDWCAPKPWLIAFPENEAVEGWEWPDGATVTLTIDNAPGLEWSGTAAVTTWGDARTYVRFDFWEDYNLQVGDVVTLTDGTTTRTHTVQNLSVTDVSADADTVSGTANPGAVVRAWPHGHDQIATLQITTGDDGTWMADFATVGFNLVPGIGGRSQVGDEAGNWTAVDWNVPIPGWQQVNISGFGNPETGGVISLEVFRGQLYAGAANGNAGGEVWRLGEDAQWLPVVEEGFGNGPTNPAVIDLAVFKNQLYAGVGWDDAPGQVWRSLDGTNWQSVTTDGFGVEENTVVSSFAVFKGKLYAGTGSTIGSAQIWRSNTGKDGSWTQVAPDQSGLTGNVTGFAVYKGALYAAIESSSEPTEPAQVWRSTNGSDWTTVIADGFGDPNNISTGGFAVFDGYLYLGTRNDATGGQIWRTVDGINWDLAMGDGFGDMNNVKIESLLVYNELLYAATFNPPMGLQIWRSADGINWEQIVANGFDDSNNFAILWNNATALYQGRMVIGTWNTVEGGEVWMSTP